MIKKLDLVFEPLSVGLAATSGRNILPIPCDAGSQIRLSSEAL